MGGEHEAAAVTMDRRHPCRTEQLGTAVGDGAQERVEHVAGSVGIGKELAVFFLMQANPERLEEGDDITSGVGTENLRTIVSVSPRSPAR